MKCDNIFCIYQENDACKCESEINIDWRGFCRNMIPVKVNYRTLSGNKRITQLYMKDINYYFDKEKGRVTIKDEAFQLYDSEYLDED